MLKVVDMVVDGAPTITFCIMKDLLYFEDASGAVPYGLIYAKRFAAGTTGACETQHNAVNSFLPNWPPVELPTGQTPNLDPNNPITASVGVTPAIAGKYYLTINGCITYYFKDAVDAVSAHDAIDILNWPALNPGGGMIEAACQYLSPPTPPPTDDGICIQGHWPLYLDNTRAIAMSPSNSHYTYIFHDVSYHMPNNFPGAQTSGDCPEYALTPVPPSPASPPMSPPPIYVGRGCNFFTTASYSAPGVKTKFGKDDGLSGPGLIAQPTIGSSTTAGDLTLFSQDIYLDTTAGDAAWVAYAATLDMYNDRFFQSANVDERADVALYYELRVTASNENSYAVSNARCVKMCQLWDKCVTYEYEIEGAGKPDNGAYSGGGGGTRMKCELWVYPFDVHSYTVSDNVANEGKVWCGAAAGDYANDGTQDPQDMPILEAKGEQPWPPGDKNLIVAINLLEASAYKDADPPGYVEAEIWGYLDGSSPGGVGFRVGDRMEVTEVLAYRQFVTSHLENYEPMLASCGGQDDPEWQTSNRRRRAQWAQPASVPEVEDALEAAPGPEPAPAPWPIADAPDGRRLQQGMGTGPVEIDIANVLTEGGFTECQDVQEVLIIRDLTTVYGNQNPLQLNAVVGILWAHDELNYNTQTNSWTGGEYGANSCADGTSYHVSNDQWLVQLPDANVPTVAAGAAITAIFGVRTVALSDGGANYFLTIRPAGSDPSAQACDVYIHVSQPAPGGGHTPGTIAELIESKTYGDHGMFTPSGTRTGVVCRNEDIGDPLTDMLVQTALGYYGCLDTGTGADRGESVEPRVMAITDAARPEGYRLLWAKAVVGGCDETCANVNGAWPAAVSTTPGAPYCPRDGTNQCSWQIDVFETVTSAHGNTFRFSRDTDLYSCCMYHYYDDATPAAAFDGIANGWSLVMQNAIHLAFDPRGDDGNFKCYATQAEYDTAKIALLQASPSPSPGDGYVGPFRCRQSSQGLNNQVKAMNVISFAATDPLQCSGCLGIHATSRYPDPLDLTGTAPTIELEGCRMYEPRGGSNVVNYNTGDWVRTKLIAGMMGTKDDCSNRGDDLWGPIVDPFGRLLGDFTFATSQPVQRLMTSMTMAGTVETFQIEPFTLMLASEMGVNASDVNVAVEAASVRVLIDMTVPKRTGVQSLKRMQKLVQRTNYMSVLFGTPVESVEPVSLVDFSPPPPLPPMPPGKAPRPPPAPPPTPPPQADVCDYDGRDDRCSPFANAEWSAAYISSYHFYLYDETPDGVDLRLWEWPRVTPRDDQLANNGVCEDGQPAFNASIPEGQYYVAFGGAECATHHVNLSTGLIAGCGRVDLVPCTLGTDCADCGRSAVQEKLRQREAAAAAHVTYPRRTGARRRRAQALPALQDAQELHHLNRTLAKATSWHLPGPWLEALRVVDHPILS